MLMKGFVVYFFTYVLTMSVTGSAVILLRHYKRVDRNTSEIIKLPFFTLIVNKTRLISQLVSVAISISYLASILLLVTSDTAI